MTRPYKSSPTVQQINDAQTKAGLTDQQCAELLECSAGAWRDWKGGRHRMPNYAFRLFEILVERNQPAPLTGMLETTERSKRMSQNQALQAKRRIARWQTSLSRARLRASRLRETRGDGGSEPD